MRAIAFVVCLLALTSRGWGEPPEWRDREHTRHEHPHGAKHPTEVNPDRFETTRRSPVVLPLPGEEDAFFFVVFGDRTGGPPEGVAVLKDAVRDVNLLEPDLVMTVGDLVNGYNQAGEWMEQMREYRGIMDHLLCPWFPVAGNHDIYWRPLDDAGMPRGQHEHDYEMHFGPLWYAFEHKNSWFIALYSDEGNPETGEKDFNKPAAQRMSDEQLDWLKQTLEKAKDADHVFLFLHHPRWRKENYGDDWDRVHQVLVDAGNVTAVFAGHIHEMKYQEDDGIEYFALATVGGGQAGLVPSTGWLHQYDIVTVRKDQIAVASYPVGAAMDPRELTEDLTASSVTLSHQTPTFEGGVRLADDGSTLGTVRVTFTNPTGYGVDVTLIPGSDDPRWYYGPEHEHGHVPAGESRTFEFMLGRGEGPVDAAYRDPQIAVEAELLTDAFRYAIPETVTAMPVDVGSHRPARPEGERVLRLDGRNGVAVLPSDAYELPDGSFTLECWFRARSFGSRVGMIAKTEMSDYGIFVSNGTPVFSVMLGDAYANATGAEGMLTTGEWHHAAGVYDGSEVRLYIDGKLAARTAASGERVTNDFPFMIGSDVDWSGRPTSFFDGDLDAVRLSRGARYTGESFTPARRAEADADSVWAFNMDGELGRRVFDDRVEGAEARLSGGSAVVAGD